MDWTWFHKWGSPKWFYELSGKWLPWLVGAMFTFLLIGVTWALLFVPEDYQQGLTNRIFYVHVPVASISLAFFPLMAMSGTVFLVWRMKLADVVVKVAAPLGAWFTALALASGSIWGVDTWGTWWVWDGRLTSLLLQFFLLLGVVSLRTALEDSEGAARACALLSIVGCINVVVIKYSVDWWNTLHQTSSNFTLAADQANGPEIWLPLIFMIVAVYLFFAISLILSTRNEILQREKRAQWVMDLVAKS
ncbi:MAG: heme ABC transporter permease [Gammaproteobacteria bacterium]|nr:heme ABC transporter permease [Gammaproteobacteria bacterium]